MCSGEAGSRLRAFGLALLLLLRLVFWRGLAPLEWFLHVLCRLVGLAIVVDGYLSLTFFGYADNLVAVGIYTRGFGLSLLGVILEIGGILVTTSIYDFTDIYLLACEIGILFRLIQRDVTPLFQTLDIAVLIVPSFLSGLELFIFLLI